MSLRYSRRFAVIHNLAPWRGAGFSFAPELIKHHQAGLRKLFLTLYKKVRDKEFAGKFLSW
jgi:hypothetical protein